MILSCQNINKTFIDNHLLKDVSFHINEYDKAALIGINGCGKTTLLRDLIRCISDGQGIQPYRVGVAEERGELAATFGGEPQMNIGARTDVVDGCPKAAAILLLLRGMNPQVLAVDEITAPEDAEAMEMAVGCGVTLLATAHGASRRDLERRPLYCRLIKQGIFTRVVTIRIEQGKRRYTVENVGEEKG